MLKRSISHLYRHLYDVLLELRNPLGSERLHPKRRVQKPAGVTKPPESSKKGERFVIKGREYCYECIDNSECLGCHTEISERKFAQSVHGANSCNSCHWDMWM